MTEEEKVHLRFGVKSCSRELINLICLVNGPKHFLVGPEKIKLKNILIYSSCCLSVRACVRASVCVRACVCVVML